MIAFLIIGDCERPPFLCFRHKWTDTDVQRNFGNDVEQWKRRASLKGGPMITLQGIAAERNRAVARNDEIRSNWEEQRYHVERQRFQLICSYAILRLRLQCPLKATWRMRIGSNPIRTAMT